MALRNDESIPVLNPYNPLDKRHLGEQVAEALLAQDVQPLPPSRFIGAGVYALYYIGDFPAYATLAEVNKNDLYLCPIYVGKAVPEGARKADRAKMSIPVQHCISVLTTMQSPSKRQQI